MITCPYCRQPATMKILSNPQLVCREHALEFWSGLLTYAKDRSEPCVKHQQVCACQRCEAAAMAFMRTEAIAAAGPSPHDHSPFALRLAS